MTSRDDEGMAVTDRAGIPHGESQVIPEDLVNWSAAEGAVWLGHWVVALV